MLDEYRLKAMTIGDYIDDVYERKIKSDQAVQRAFCWSNEAINNLVYSTLSKKRIYIPNVILAEENNDNGTIKTYIVDGGQRTEALARFIKEGHKISKSIRNRYVEYQTTKKDKDGNLILDDDGDPISELVTYDLVGKTFDDLPPELKKRIIGGNLAAAIYQDCTPDETSELVLLYNSTVGMTVSQKSLTYVGRFADKIKKIKENRFLIDGTMLNEREKKNGEWERAIFECVMAMFYLDDWKKDPKKICAYLNENAKENDFNTLNEYFTKLIPYSDKLKNIEVAELFIKKDMMAWMTFVKRMVELEISDEEIGEFLLAFNDLKEEEINGTTWIELDQNKHTKDKKVIVEKINYLTTLALEYLHKNPENFDTNQEDNICETENSDEDSDDADVENNTYDEKDYEMEPLEFIRENVDPNLNEEDLDDYYEYLDCCVDSKKPILKKDSDIISERNENSILAVIAYTYKENIDMDDWLKRYSITHPTINATSQKQRYMEMVASLNRFISAKAQKVGVA